MRREREKYMRNDMILIIFLCLIAVILSVCIYMGRSSSQLAVEILVDGKLVHEVALEKNKSLELTLEEGNVISISNGYVYMKSAECPDGLCVKQGHINKLNESIICLPHKVVIRLVNISDNAPNNGLDVMPR